MAGPNFANRTLYHGDNLPFLRGTNSKTVQLLGADARVTTLNTRIESPGDHAGHSSDPMVWDSQRMRSACQPTIGTGS